MPGLKPMICCYLQGSEDAHSRFDPRNRLPWNAMGLFKIHINSLQCFVSDSQWLLRSLCYSSLRFPLSDNYCYDVVARCIFTIQQWLISQMTPAWLWISGNMWLRKIQRKRYSCDFFGGIQAASSMQVRVLWRTLSGLPSIKEAIFCNNALAYLPCHLHPFQYSLRRTRLIRRLGTAP